jgi:hypothetical protein
VLTQHPRNSQFFIIYVPITIIIPWKIKVVIKSRENYNNNNNNNNNFYGDKSRSFTLNENHRWIDRFLE